MGVRHFKKSKFNCIKSLKNVEDIWVGYHHLIVKSENKYYGFGSNARK